MYEHLLKALKDAPLRTKILWIAFAINTLCTLSYTFNIYRIQKYSILDGIDLNLSTAARTLPFLLPKGYHDEVIGLGSSDPLEYYENTLKLTAYCKQAGIVYLYSYIRSGRNFYVASTSETEQTLKSGNTTTLYTVYKQPPPAMLEAWTTGQTQFAVYEDEFGQFRSIFVPMRTETGNLYIIGADVDIDFLEARLEEALFGSLLLGFAIFMGVWLFSYYVLTAILDPICKLTDYMAELTEGGFRPTQSWKKEVSAIPKKIGGEVGKLARAFIDMEGKLSEYIENLQVTTAVKERIESELKIAANIQSNFLSRNFDIVEQAETLDLYALVEPAKEVGGDLYDFFFVGKNRLVFVIGDVSDKGVPAALFMAVTLAIFKSIGKGETQPDQILQKLNHSLCSNNTSEQFVTLFCGILNIDTGELLYSNGGHNTPYLISAKQGGVTRLCTSDWGLALGVIEEEDVYQTFQITLEPGDTLFLYTDGVTDATNNLGEFYHSSRLQSKLEVTSVQGSSKALVSAVFDDVKHFSQGVPQADDITIMGVHYVGNAKKGVSKAV